MKILQLSTYDIQGGAARASYRLARGLRSIGEDSKILAGTKTAGDDFIHDIHAALEAQAKDFSLYNNVIQEYYIDRHRTGLSNTLFSLSCSGYDVSGLNIVKEADVINLHWIIGFQSVQTVANLLKLGKPVVWTLHDQWPFTGGCHYSAGCSKYKSDCSHCPQLSEDPFDVTTALLNAKIHLFKGVPLTVVTPSRWLAKCARESAVFRKHRVETIPNSLETDFFTPKDKKESKGKLGIDPLATVLLIGAENGKEKRKGYRELVLAIEHCMTDPRFADLVAQKNLQVLIFGHAGEELVKTGLTIHSFGYVNSDELLTDMYSAADFFVLPSLEDNLPNTMLESMSCGSPVIAFDVGGMPDVIKSNVTGLIVPLGDTAALGDAILNLAFDRNKRENMSQNCRKLMIEHYALEVQARNYSQLYHDLIAKIGCNNVVSMEHAHKNHESGQEEDEAALQVKKICDQSLLKSFKELVPEMKKQILEIESDRAARLEVIYRLQAQIEALTRHSTALSEELKTIKNSRYWKIYIRLKQFIR